VTDRRRLSPDARTVRDQLVELERWADEAYGRVELLHLREPDLDGRTLWALAGRLAARAAGSGTRVVVNDRADVARSSGAAGVHLKAAGPPGARVRAFCGATAVVGRSIHDPDEARRGEGLDYFVFGTVFPSASKPGIAGLGLAGLRAAASAAAIPVLAIGGVTPELAASCVEAGAWGVAAIGLFLPPGREPGSLGFDAASDALRRACAAC
jgi:thiamine-phosphate diphosphorylase